MRSNKLKLVKRFKNAKKGYEEVIFVKENMCIEIVGCIFYSILLCLGTLELSYFLALPNTENFSFITGLTVHNPIWFYLFFGVIYTVTLIISGIVIIVKDGRVDGEDILVTLMLLLVTIISGPIALIFVTLISFLSLSKQKQSN